MISTVLLQNIFINRIRHVVGNIMIFQRNCVKQNNFEQNSPVLVLVQIHTSHSK